MEPFRVDELEDGGRIVEMADLGFVRADEAADGGHELDGFAAARRLLRTTVLPPKIDLPDVFADSHWMALLMVAMVVS